MSDETVVDYASVDDLLAGDDLGQQDVLLPNGKTVTVKGLTSYERQLSLKGAIHSDGSFDNSMVELKIIRMGLVNPKLSEAQVENWVKKASVGTINVVSTKIRDLSGLGEGAEKS